MLIKKILIGVDNSKYADNAAKYGFDIAQKFNAAVGLVHIVEPVVTSYNTNTDPLLGSPDAGLVDVDLMNIQNSASISLMDETIKKYGNGIEVAHFNEFGDTADGIINCSIHFGADLIVIGTHSRSGIDRLLMGSIAEHVVRHSVVPVLVVPMEDEDES